MQGLTEGRIVHFVQDSDRQAGNHIPAIVTSVWNKEVGTITVTAFPDAANNDDVFSSPAVPVTSISFDDDEKKQGTWHWIEQA